MQTNKQNPFRQDIGQSQQEGISHKWPFRDRKHRLQRAQVQPVRRAKPENSLVATPDPIFPAQQEGPSINLPQLLAYARELPADQQRWLVGKLTEGLGSQRDQAQRETADAASPRPRFGSARGTVWMSEDFDAPLEGFEEYMP
jgi:hypothetical protein